MNASQIAVIVPCYNEANRLQPSAFQSQVEARDDLHFFFVNDGSKDKTLALLHQMCAPHPGRMNVVNLPRNQGKAEAVRQGVLAAFELGYDYVGFWDADLATPLHHIFDFAAVLDARPQVLMVMGSRVKLLGRQIQRNPMRHYAGRVFATATSLLLKLPVYDTQCGAKLFRNDEALLYAFGSRFEVNWIFDVELLARLTLFEQARGRDDLEPLIVEFPLDQWTDVPGSKLSSSDFVTSGLDLLRIARLLYGPKKGP